MSKSKQQPIVPIQRRTILDARQRAKAAKIAFLDAFAPWREDPETLRPGAAAGKESFLTHLGACGTTTRALAWLRQLAAPRNDSMHELPVTQAILDTALATARQAGAPRVLAIDLVIGELSGIVDDSVQFYFDILSRDTPAAGAVLRFQRQAGRALCPDCGHGYAVAPPLAPFCPECGGARVQVSGGRAFFLESIEIDD